MSRSRVSYPDEFLVMDVAYWTRSLSDRLQRLTSDGHHPHLGCEEAVLDDETRRLLDDSHLLIATQRLELLDIIGQGPITTALALRALVSYSV